MHLVTVALLTTTALLAVAAVDLPPYLIVLGVTGFWGTVLWHEATRRHAREAVLQADPAAQVLACGTGPDDAETWFRVLLQRCRAGDAASVRAILKRAPPGWCLEDLVDQEYPGWPHRHPRALWAAARDAPDVRAALRSRMSGVPL